MYGGYGSGSHQYAYNLRDQTVQRVPSGIFFDLSQIDAGREEFESLEKGVDPFNIFPAFHNLDSGYVSNNSASASTSSTGGETRCLPLLDVDIEVDVQSTISTTKVTQTFTNLSNHVLKETNYTFPLYDGSAVISFKCHIGEDKLLDGVIKPKEVARKEFKEAVAKQKVAALLEEHTPEVFETKLGNIPAETIVKVEINYVNELKTDIGGEGVLVTLPTSIAPRYGTPPPLASTSSATEKVGLHITVNVYASVSLRKLESRTHPISVEMGTTGNSEALAAVPSFADLVVTEKDSNDDFDPKKAKATLSDRRTNLGRDFVLLILASGTSMLASEAQLQEGGWSGELAAMKLTLNPRDLFSSYVEPESFKGEIVFIADRSGSMHGPKMETLKNALNVFLKSLSEEVHFNIYSFGSSFTSLWPRSQRYTDENVDLALGGVSTFTANMGGTEILQPIKDAVQRRLTMNNFSTQIIVLTDGETWHEASVRGFVRDTRSRFKSAVRFFALGIGSAVSHRLVEGIGTEGGGFSEVVDIDGAGRWEGRWEGRVMRMLKGALTPESYQCEIEFDGKATKQLCSSSEGRTFMQAPYSIPALHPFSRTSIYFLFDIKYGTHLSLIRVKTSMPSGEEISVEIPVSKVTASTYTVQHLAAKAIVMDLETGKSWLHGTGSNNTAAQAAAKELGERLAIQYHITSKWTSFVALEKKRNEENAGRLYKAPRGDLAMLNKSRTAPMARALQPTVMHYRGMRTRILTDCTSSSGGYEHSRGLLDKEGALRVSVPVGPSRSRTDVDRLESSVPQAPQPPPRPDLASFGNYHHETQYQPSYGSYQSGPLSPQSQPIPYNPTPPNPPAHDLYGAPQQYSHNTGYSQSDRYNDAILHASIPEQSSPSPYGGVERHPSSFGSRMSTRSSNQGPSPQPSISSPPSRYLSQTLPHRTDTLNRHPQSRPFPGPPSESESDRDFFPGQNGQDESGFEDIMKEVDAAISQGRLSSSASRRNPEINRTAANYQDTNRDSLFSYSISPHLLSPDEVPTHINGNVASSGDTNINYGAFSDNSDTEAAISVTAIIKAERLEAEENAQKKSRSASLFSGSGLQRQSKQRASSTQDVSSDSDSDYHNVDMGFFGGGYGAGLYYGDKPASHYAPAASMPYANYYDRLNPPLGSTRSSARSSNERESQLNGYESIPGEDSIHPFPQSRHTDITGVDTSGTGRLTEPSPHPRRLNYEDGDEANLQDLFHHPKMNSQLSLPPAPSISDPGNQLPYLVPAGTYGDVPRSISLSSTRSVPKPDQPILSKTDADRARLLKQQMQGRPMSEYDLVPQSAVISIPTDTPIRVLCSTPRTQTSFNANPPDHRTGDDDAASKPSAGSVDDRDEPALRTSDIAAVQSTSQGRAIEATSSTPKRGEKKRMSFLSSLLGKRSKKVDESNKALTSAFKESTQLKVEPPGSELGHSLTQGVMISRVRQQAIQYQSLLAPPPPQLGFGASRRAVAASPAPSTRQPSFQQTWSPGSSKWSEEAGSDSGSKDLNIHNLIHMQSVKGSFMLPPYFFKDVCSNFKSDVSTAFEEILSTIDPNGQPLKEKLRDTMEPLLHTMLAVTWIKMMCSKDKDIWELLVGKAERWVIKIIGDKDVEGKLWECVKSQWVRSAG